MTRLCETLEEANINLIAAVDRNWNIGKDGQLLFYIPEDMKYFREKTTGKVVVMGRKTLESFPGGKPLKNRTNVVLTTNPDYRVEGVVVVCDMQQLACVLSEFSEDDVYVIGGGTVYRQLLPLCDTAYITKVDRLCDADTSIPNLDEDPEWLLRIKQKGGEADGASYDFCTYKRKK